MMSSIENRLRHYLKTVPSSLKKIPAQELLFRPDINKWSKQEIFGHLCDSAVHNLSRFGHAAKAIEKFKFKSYSQNDLVQSNDYQGQALSELIILWYSLNQQILRTWSKMPREQWQLPIENSDQNLTGDLQFLAEDYVNHMEHHLRQIFGDLEMFKPYKDQLSIAAGERKLKQQAEQRFVTLMKHGSMSVELYHPLGEDLQQPHDQDELYVVISGTGIFYRGGDRSNCKAGDVLFVPAGVVHRFENFTDDFKVWVVFYGPHEGERMYTPVEKEMKVGNTTYLVSTKSELLEEQVIFSFLQSSYWAKGRPAELLRRSIAHSLNFGLFADGAQIGFARIITDYATVAYLADVFVLPEYRGKELGKFLLDVVINHPQIKQLPKVLLHTKDAHSLYEEFGFKRNPRPDIWMERLG